MPFKYAYIIPIVQGILFPATFFLTYALAVINKDLPKVFPYISDLGVWSIQSCIFTFNVGLGALLILIIMYIRYRQVREVFESDLEESYTKSRAPNLNEISIHLGAVSMLGLFVAASFQVYPYWYVHLMGFGLCFLFGYLFIVMQTYISFAIFPTLGSKCLNMFRAILVVLIGSAGVSTILFGSLSLFKFKGGDFTQWFRCRGGYELHIVSVVSEWVLVFGAVLYFALYAGEFKSLVVYKPKVIVVKIYKL